MKESKNLLIGIEFTISINEKYRKILLMFKNNLLDYKKTIIIINP